MNRSPVTKQAPEYRRYLVAGLLLIALLIGSTPLPVLTAAAQTADDDALPPVLAYYYIWFNPTSWNRAKIDLPLLGPYSSDDPEVMRQHVRWAKASGIDGFIVSWKHTESLSKRLALLVEVAREEDFKLTIIYEGLDFYRTPLPIDRINYDLTWFVSNYGNDPVFDIFGDPVVIWSGTWKFSRDDIERITDNHRDHLQILASSKQVSEYEAIADLVDGNAYYWSSVDPETHPDYAGKLTQMSDAVHANGGLWLAPAAPGFDARHIGGQREVLRQDGETLRTQFTTSLASNPDAVALISWNEFSENSHIEPSCEFGDRYLEVTAELLGVQHTTLDLPCDQDALATAQAGAHIASPVSAVSATPSPLAYGSQPFDWDSSAPQGSADRGARMGTLVLLGMFGGLMAFSAVMITRRSLHDEDDNDRSQGPPNPLRPEGELS
jgi:hypothetical protein